MHRRALLTENPNEGEKKKGGEKKGKKILYGCNIVATRSGRDFSSAIDYASSSECSGAKELYEKRRSELVRV